MMLPLRLLLGSRVLVVGCALFIQVQAVPQDFPPSPREREKQETRLPNGKLQKDEIVKADHAKNLEEAGELLKLAEELKIDLEKNTEYVFSVTDMKKTEEIEKLAKRIRSRMKRY
jgi:hypothetical protein